ncbi:MAG: hypothetical protein VW709_20680, partial [Rickettsiales bacterium]
QGIHEGLMRPDRDLAACVETAERAFDRDMALVADERREAERKKLAGYVEHGLAELRQYGVPTAAQERVEIRLEDVAVPVIGFIDWRFDQHGLVIDLKTAERLPSGINDSQAKAWIYNNEDDADELRRRLAAVLQHW